MKFKKYKKLVLSNSKDAKLLRFELLFNFVNPSEKREALKLWNGFENEIKSNK